MSHPTTRTTHRPRPGPTSRTGSAATTSGSLPASTRFDEETRAFLQQRLRLLTGTVAVISGVLMVAFFPVVYGSWGLSLAPAIWRFATEFPNAVLVALVTATTVLHVVLRTRRISSWGLVVLDAVFTQVLIVPCLILYARGHFFSFSAFPVVVPFLVLFILARAVFVPSGAWLTVLLSLSAPVGVLWIQLQNGASFAFPGQPYSPAHFKDMLIQNQVLLLGAIAVASTASRVNLALRRRSYDARRLGQYDLEEKIGAGGMGEVYRATHSLLKRATAIKLMRPELAGEQNLRRFEREVRQTSRLSHPNTVSIYDYGHTAEGVFYYAMELLRGANLREIVKVDAPLPPSRVIHVLTQACGALQEAHAMGMVHRDVKPENMMLCEQGGELDVLKIVDFGLVKEFEASAGTTDGEPMAGTPETMAPEAISGGRITPVSDLYSLCAVGCFLLTGAAIFDARNAAEFLRCHREEAPIPPSRRRPDVPQDLETVLMRGLQKDPAKRPESVTQLRTLLQECARANAWFHADAVAWWEEFGPRLGEREEAAVAPTGTVLMTQPLQSAGDSRG